MKCKDCEYEGWSEFGNWESPYGLTHWRCPICTGKPLYLGEEDIVVAESKWPTYCIGVNGQHEKTRNLVTYDSFGYSVTCPRCGWGHASIGPVDQAILDGIQQKIKELAGIIP